jgi:pimeloyl-ACP methyl ester carboxylesterase
LSSIGSRHPERVAGLVYLDAGYQYAYYDSSQAYVGLSIHDVQHKLARLLNPLAPLSAKTRQELVAELLDSGLPQLERDLREWKRNLAAVPNQTATPPPAQGDAIMRLLDAGAQKYTSIRGPVLAIYAAPHEVPEAMRDSAARARFDSTQLAVGLPQIRAFERGVPSARVVTIPHANHYVFRSNEEVGDEIADPSRPKRAGVDRTPSAHHATRRHAPLSICAGAPRIGFDRVPDH